MATRVKFSELELAFDFVSFEGLTEHRAYVRKDSGEILCGSNDLDEEEEELPDDIDDEEKYLAIPTKRGLRAGIPPGRSGPGPSLFQSPRCLWKLQGSPCAKARDRTMAQVRGRSCATRAAGMVQREFDRADR